NGNQPELRIQGNPVSKTNTLDDLPTKDLFEFLAQEHSPNADIGLFSLLPDAQDEDYEEEQFAKRIKKKLNSRRK
ncbi:MAG: relaxase, partial [Chryseobacterium sp.]|nr:relaxase [Chryseobacterium sp.]